MMTICASVDTFGVYPGNYYGVWVAGDTVEACKADARSYARHRKRRL